MQNKYAAQEMTIEGEKPGFQYPPIARRYGFMNPVDTMDTVPPCECKSLSNGVATGVGIAVGAGIVAGAVWGILKLLKR